MNTNSFSALGLIVIAAASAVSCGGGGSGDEVGTEANNLLSGVFVDSPVAGLTYVTPTVSGVTDADGVFNYRQGEAVVFSIGQLSLPVVVASEMVTPLDMVESEDVTDPSVVNIARLLQSLDDDSDPSNGIVIPEAVSENFTESEVYDVTDDTAVDAVVEKAFGGNRDAVNSVAAVSHFIDTLSDNSDSEAGLRQWQYLVSPDSTFQGDTLYIDENSFSLTVDGENHTGNTTINRGVYQLREGNQKWFVSVSTDDQTQFICLAKSPKPVSNCDDNLYRVFAEEAQALEFNSNTSSVEDLDIGAGTDSQSEATESPVIPAETVSEAEVVPVAEAGPNEGQSTQGQSTDQSDNSQQPAFASGRNESSEPTLEELFPPCEPGTRDDDGDGFGWQNYRSCLIKTSDAQEVMDPVPASEVAGEETQSGTGLETVDVVEIPTIEEALPAIEEEIVDLPVEAEAIESVDVAEPATEVTSPSTDSATTDVEPVANPDVDIDNTVTAAPVEAVVETPSSEPVTEDQPVSLPEAPVEEVSPIVEVAPPETVAIEVVDNIVAEQIQPVAYQPSDITDLIILTGQSNAAALRTAFDAALDGGHERLFAFAEDGQWEVADLHQAWDASMPGNFSDTVEGQEPYNNLVFQIGKSIAERSDRVVGIILVSAPGEGISHWDYNSYFYQKIQRRAAAALEALPQKSSIDAVMWMQGETDWLYEGTADEDATGFSSTDSDFYRNYYPTKLSQFIGNLRSEWWFGPQSKFICGETKKAELNPHLMALNSDNDSRTGCAQASDLPVRADDAFGNHFSAEALRILGRRIADIYLSN